MSKIAPDKYARILDVENPGWSTNSAFNEILLKTVENHCNDVIKRRGWITLNEVYELLHIPVSREHLTIGFKYEEGKIQWLEFEWFILDSFGKTLLVFHGLEDISIKNESEDSA